MSLEKCADNKMRRIIYEVYMVSDWVIRNGGDKLLSPSGVGAELQDTSSATSVIAMRTATKNILYGIANSNAMDESNFGMASWTKMIITANIVIVVLLAIAEIFSLRKFKKLKKEHAEVTEEKVQAK